MVQCTQLPKLTRDVTLGCLDNKLAPVGRLHPILRRERLHPKSVSDGVREQALPCMFAPSPIKPIFKLHHMTCRIHHKTQMGPTLHSGDNNRTYLNFTGLFKVEWGKCSAF